MRDFTSSFSLYLPCHAACGILIPWPGIEPIPPALEAWSLNHWTPGKSPSFSFKSSNGWKQWTHNATSSTWHQRVLNLPGAPLGLQYTTKTWRLERKHKSVPFFRWHNCLCRKSHGIYQKQTAQPINEFNQITGYKINIHTRGSYF